MLYLQDVGCNFYVMDMFEAQLADVPRVIWYVVQFLLLFWKGCYSQQHRSAVEFKQCWCSWLLIMKWNPEHHPSGSMKVRALFISIVRKSLQNKKIHHTQVLEKRILFYLSNCSSYTVPTAGISLGLATLYNREAILQCVINYTFNHYTYLPQTKPSILRTSIFWRI